MIRIHDVTKSYDGTVVLDHVSLDIPRGGITTLVGANGAGKSTLLSIMSRLLAPDSGRVEVDGLDVATAPGADIAKKLSILRQDTYLTARITVRELVEFGRFPYSKGRLGPEDHDHVARAMKFFELDELSDRPIHQLSGGQRQRAFVAMVLAQDTDYVLLDEPLNNLDMRHAAEMMGLLRRFADEQDKTVVLVLHDINFASIHSDSIVALRSGRLVHQGSPATFMDPGVLGDVFGMPIDVHTVGNDLVGFFYR